MNYAFQVIEIAENGTFIAIKPTFDRDTQKHFTKGQPIPDFTFRLQSGEETSIHNLLNGKKMLYLNYWASWCAGCHSEIDVCAAGMASLFGGPGLYLELRNC